MLAPSKGSVFFPSKWVKLGKMFTANKIAKEHPGFIHMVEKTSCLF